jgi:uncharacterized membrane protein
MDDQYQPVAMAQTGRMEAFIDGVLAIAVTLLVLDLHVPQLNALHEALAVALVHEWPAYAAYVTSFLIIGTIWVNHHAVFELVGLVDRKRIVAQPAAADVRSGHSVCHGVAVGVSARR